MIWILYLVMMNASGEFQEWDPGMEPFATLEECEAERDAILDKVTLEMSGFVLQDVKCDGEVVGIMPEDKQASSPWNGVSNLLGMRI